MDLLREALGLAKIHIVAHSMGTYLVMNYQEEHPERVKGLVLMGAMLPRTPKTDAEKQLLQQQQSASAQFIKRPEIDEELHRQGLDKETKILTPQQITAAWRIHFAGANIVHLDRAGRVKGGSQNHASRVGLHSCSSRPSLFDMGHRRRS